MTTAVTVTDRSALAAALRDLKLSGMLETLDARLAQAHAGELGHLDFLQVLCQDEISRRETTRLPVAARAHGASGRSRTACLPRTKIRSGQVSYRGMSWGTRARTWTLLLQGQACCLVTPFPIKIGEDSVRRQGFEPRTLPIKSRML